MEATGAYSLNKDTLSIFYVFYVVVEGLIVPIFILSTIALGYFIENKVNMYFQFLVA